MKTFLVIGLIVTFIILRGEIEYLQLLSNALKNFLDVELLHSQRTFMSSVVAALRAREAHKRSQQYGTIGYLTQK